jgi:hypothetical protein
VIVPGSELTAGIDESILEELPVSLATDLVEEGEVSSAAVVADNVTITAECAEDIIVEETTDAESSSDSQSVAVPESPVSEPVDLFEVTVQPSARRARTKANDSILTVSILIGIGNKPYLRGSGGGLSWETGVPMDFEEIGKWRWVAPADLEAPVELQVYRNDEDADRKGRHTLQPGQKLEVSPVF